jgi:hypothetical protein
MRPRKYPLEPLARVRQMGVDGAARDAAAAVRAREEASGRRQQAEQSRTAHDERARAVRDAERNALERGALTAADLSRALDWEVRVTAECATLARAEESARSEESNAMANEQAARAELAHKKAESEVVEKDRAKWRERERARAEAKEEEAAAEAWRPR